MPEKIHSQNPVILDTDPGIDDAVALIVLHHFCPEQVKLILTSYGNISVDKTTNNALTMCSLLNWDVPVVRGSSAPEPREAGMPHLEDAAHIHGADGLGGLSLSFPEGAAFEGDFLQKTYDTIRALGKVDYITLGPLTNLALLMKRFPDVTGSIGQIVSMGGGIGLGNATPTAEFNIHCDPISADYVFRTAGQLTLVPLNTTNHVAFSLEDIHRMAARNTPVSLAMEKILTANYHSCVRYGEKGSTMHDSTAVLCWMFPWLFCARQCGITAECGEFFGRTVLTDRRDNVLLTGEAETERILSLIEESVEERP